MQLRSSKQVDEALKIALAEIGRNPKLTDIFMQELLSGELYNHSIGVAKIATQLMFKLNFKQKDIIETAIGAILHDIGKLAVPQEILYKPGSLTEEEFELIKKHPLKGYNMLVDKGLSEQSLSVVLFHHEKSGGLGYPTGLKNVPINIQLVTLADIFSAMTERRCYHTPITIANALRYVDNMEYLNNSGVDALFDEIVD